MLTRVMSGRDTASLDTGAGATAANNVVDDLSEVIRSLDKEAQDAYSLRLLLAADSKAQLHDAVPTVHRIFVGARAQVVKRLSGTFLPSPWFQQSEVQRHPAVAVGEAPCPVVLRVRAPPRPSPLEDLGAEYLHVLETRTRTPFFQDAHVDSMSKK